MFFEVKKIKKKVEGRFSSEEVRGGIYLFFLTPRGTVARVGLFGGRRAAGCACFSLGSILGVCDGKVISVVGLCALLMTG